MHPYRMQALIKQRGKDRVVNVRQRASIYQMIERLLRDGLIRVRETNREPNRPERTVYELTDQGRETTLAWLREMLAATGNQFPPFAAAVSFLALLTTEDARQQLEARASELDAHLVEIDDVVRTAGDLPRLFLLEEEYRRATLAAELEWVRATVEDLRTGRLTWSEEWLQGIAAALNPQATPGDGNDA